MNPWEVQTQSEFLSLAFRWAKTKTTIKAYSWSWHNLGPMNTEVHWLYKMGRDYSLLEMDFEDFSAIMKGTHPRYTEGKYYPWRRKYHTCSHFSLENYRRSRSFRQKDARYQKKIRDKVQEEWWEHKGFVRDRRRKKYSTTWNASLKETTRSKHRCWERDMIIKEKFNVFHNNSWKSTEDR